MTQPIDPAPEKVTFMLNVPFGSSSSVLLCATEVQTKVYTDIREWSPNVTSVSVRYRSGWSTDGMITVRVDWLEEEGKHTVLVSNPNTVKAEEVPLNV